MEKQVEEVYIISKFQEFQQELMNKMYCEVFSYGDQNMKSLKIMKRVKRRLFKLFFKRKTVKFVVRVQCLNVEELFANMSL